MPQPKLSKKLAKQAIEVVQKAIDQGYRAPGLKGTGVTAIGFAARRLRMPRGTLRGRIKIAENLYGFKLKISIKTTVISEEEDVDAKQGISHLIRKKSMTLDDLASEFSITKGEALDIIEELKSEGLNVHQFGEHWSIEKDLLPSFLGGPFFDYVSRDDNTFYFGVISDTHYGSSYCREDVCRDLYRRFEEHKVDRVFHGGNYVDGEIRFNKHELSVHGMHNQIQYLADNYPKIDGVKTYAISGDDHEGWWAQREGINIGKYTEGVMRESGRDDWVDLGYMEAHIRLINKNTGRFCVLAVVHPGGGQAYADSYPVQKTIEAYEGGEKPAVGIYGHWHKLLAGEYRNVWWLMAGCTKDTDSFGRKKRLRSTVGGTIVELEQDPVTGAIVGMTPKMYRYFNRDYYRNRRFGPGVDIQLPTRSL